MQTGVTIIIIAAAIGYAGWRIYKALTAPPDPCAGCPGCELKKKSSRKFCQNKEK